MYDAIPQASRPLRLSTAYAQLEPCRYIIVLPQTIISSGSLCQRSLAIRLVTHDGMSRPHWHGSGPRNERSITYSSPFALLTVHPQAIPEVSPASRTRTLPTDDRPALTGARRGTRQVATGASLLQPTNMAAISRQHLRPTLFGMERQQMLEALNSLIQRGLVDVVNASETDISVRLAGVVVQST